MSFLDTPTAGTRKIIRTPTHSALVPMESLLTQIFKPLYNKTNVIISPSNGPKKIVPKKDESFVPFFQERNKMNRLILNNKEVENREKEQDSWVSYNINGYKGMIKHTFKINKKSKHHLSNVLDLETNFRNILDLDRDGLVTWADTNQSSLIELPKFKVNWKAPEKPSTALKKANAFLSARNTSKSSTFKTEEEKPNAIFLAASRDKLEDIKKKSFQCPEVGTYNVDSLGFLKPKIPKVIFPKASLERNKLKSEMRDSPFITTFSSFDDAGHHKSVPDFAKQLSRGERKKPNKAEGMKDIDQLERDFQFSKELKQKYEPKTINFPKGIEIDVKKLPFVPSKLNETVKNLMKTHHVHKDHSQRKLKVRKGV